MYQYSFTNTNVIVTMPNSSGNEETFTVEGFKAGEDLVTIARKAPIATTDFSAYGSMIVSMQRNLSVDVALPLLHTSRENKYFQDWANEFQNSAIGQRQTFTPIQMYFEDMMGNDEAVLTNGVILAIPAVTRGLTVSTVTWVISFEQGIIYRGDGGDSENIGAPLGR